MWKFNLIRNEEYFFEFLGGVLVDSHRIDDGRSSVLFVGVDCYVVVEHHSSSAVCRLSDHRLLADARHAVYDETSFWKLFS